MNGFRDLCDFANCFTSFNITSELNTIKQRHVVVNYYPYYRGVFDKFIGDGIYFDVCQ